MTDIPLYNGSEMVQDRSIRDRWGRFVVGYAGGPGRPKGSTSLKMFAQEFLKGLSVDDKAAFLRMIDPQEVWRMAEGNPHSTEDVTHSVVPTPILDLGTLDSKKIDSGVIENDPIIKLKEGKSS